MYLFRCVQRAVWGAMVTLLASLASVSVYAADKPLPVVASFSILGDIVREVGGPDIELATLVGPDSDAHTYEPTSADVRKLATARVLFVNGLGFETWLPRLLKSAGFAGATVIASQGMTPRLCSSNAAYHDHHRDEPIGHEHADDQGDSDSVHLDHHAWQNLANGVLYARNVAQALAAADPARAAAYKERADAYITKLEALDDRVKKTFAAIPEQRCKVLTSHDAFGYFGDAYGIMFIPAVGLSSDAEPSAAALAVLIAQVRREQVTAVFVENMASPKLATQIARETGAKLGGVLYSDALSKAGQPGATYLEMFEWNVRQLAAALLP